MGISNDSGPSPDHRPIPGSTWQGASLPSISTAAGFRKIISDSKDEVILVFDDQPMEGLPYARELLDLMPQDSDLIAPTQRPLGTWFAGLPAPGLSLPRVHLSYLRIGLIDSSDKSIDDILPLPANWSNFYIIRKWPDIRSLDSPSSYDVIIISRHHPDFASICERAGREGKGQVLILENVRKEDLRSISRLSIELNLCLAQFNRSIFNAGQFQSCSQRFTLLYELLLSQARQDPLKVRWVLQRVNRELLPVMRRSGFELASAFSNADSALIRPLLNVHDDEAVLFERSRNLKISPAAALDYFASNALHLRFFATYDPPDILIMPELLDVILPYLETRYAVYRAQVEMIEELQGQMLPSRLFKVASTEVQQFVRGLMQGLVILSDFGAFESQFGPLVYPNPREKFRIPEKSFQLCKTSSSEFYARLKQHGERLIKVMTLVHEFFPEEFSAEISPAFEYFYGYYGVDELTAVIQYNFNRPVERRISLSEVVNASDRPDVMEYYLQHRGRRAAGQADRKLNQFSTRARAHVLHSREVHERFRAIVSGRMPVVDDLILCRAPRELRQAANTLALMSDDLAAWACEEAAQELRSRISADRADMVKVVEYVNRFPPPKRSLNQVSKYIDEGKVQLGILSTLIEFQRYKDLLGCARYEALCKGVGIFERYVGSLQFKAQKP